MSEWSKQKLERIIADCVEESLSLDYKRAESLTNTDGRKAEIVKDVTAFANSSGGVLIYGIAEPKDRAKRYLPERLDPIRRNEISKEWIEQVIQSIQPRIEGIIIHPITIDEQGGLVCYVIEIPQSHTAHQARDHVYYKRHNFNNLAMEDYEVRDVMHRRALPNVSVKAELVSYRRTNKDGKHGALIYDITNESDTLILHYGIIVNAPMKVLGRVISYDNCLVEETRDGWSYKLNHFNHQKPPLFPRSPARVLFGYELTGPMNSEPKKLLSVFWHVVFADSMPPKKGLFTPDEIYKKL